jgi:hypothetical protein
MSKARDLADSVSTGGILEDGAVSVSEISDLTVTAAELNNVAGVNSDVQTQLDTKAPLASPTFTGNVGVGTSSPSANLEITQSGNNVGLLVAGGGYNYTAKFESSDAEANIIIEDSNSTNDGNMIGVATDDMYFLTGGSEAMRITSGGTLQIAGGGNDSVGEINMGNTAQNANRLQVRHQSSAWYLKTVDSDPLAFGTANTERFRIGTSGELGIGGTNYGTTGQVLTSGGSGAAPTWADAAGGGSARDFVASGTIANGNVVKLNSDGTVSVTTASEFVSDSTFAYNSSSQWTLYDGVYDETTNQVILGYQDPDISNHPHYVIGAVSGDQITFGTPVKIQASTCGDVNVALAHSGNVIIGFNHTGQSYKVHSYSISQGALAEVSSDNTPDTPQSRDRICKLIWLPTINSVMAIYVSGSYLTTAIWSVNSSTFSIQYQGRDFMVSGPSDIYNVCAAYDSSQDVTNFIWYNASNGYAYLKNVKVSSSYVFSASSNYNWNTSNGPAHDIAYHATAQKCFILYRKQSDSTTNLKTVTNSGTSSITVGSETLVDNTLGYLNMPSAKYNAVSDEVILSGQYPSSSSHGYVIRIGWSSGSPVISSPTKWLSANTRNWPELIPANGTRNFIIHNNYVSSYDIHSVLYDTAKTAVGYGVANASVTNGQSVEVISIGSIADNQSGLTIGTKYYYADAGGLSTSGTLQAGIAVSATELLITGADT